MSSLFPRRSCTVGIGSGIQHAKGDIFGRNGHTKILPDPELSQQSILLVSRSSDTKWMPICRGLSSVYLVDACSIFIAHVVAIVTGSRAAAHRNQAEAICHSTEQHLAKLIQQPLEVELNMQPFRHQPQTRRTPRLRSHSMARNHVDTGQSNPGQHSQGAWLRSATVFRPL